MRTGTRLATCVLPPPVDYACFDVPGESRLSGLRAKLSGRAHYAREVGAIFFDKGERAQLCDLMETLGPDAPTVLDPWTTRDLAAHLFLRENDKLAGPGLVVPGSWARFAERHRQEASRRDYIELIGAIRSGPRGVFRLGWLRRVPNLNEFFVHHEDVRRANGAGPRALDSGLNQALWSNVSSWAWYLARRFRDGELQIRNAQTGQVVRARRGQPAVRLTADPGELLLYLFGRQDAAQVEVDGLPDAAQRVNGVTFGL